METDWVVSAGVVVAVVGVVAMAFGMLWNTIKERLTSEHTRAAIEALEAGVQGEWDGWVKDAKKAAADGRLTAGERYDAMNGACTRAKSILASQGINLFTVFASEYLPALIRKIVVRRKTGDV